MLTRSEIKRVDENWMATDANKRRHAMVVGKAHLRALCRRRLASFMGPSLPPRMTDTSATSERGMPYLSSTIAANKIFHSAACEAVTKMSTTDYSVTVLVRNC